MQTVEKSSIVSVDESEKSNALVNGQHSSAPGSSSPPTEQISENGDSSDSNLKNDSEVPPPDPAAGILRPFSLSEEKLSHIQIAKVIK